MQFIVYFICGLAGGVIGGMGMGGGTLLIPLLTLLCGVEQRVAQAVNLIAFAPMAFLSLSEHKKNGLLVTDNILYLIIPAAALSFVGALLTEYIRNEQLSRAFGIFLMVLSVVQFFTAFKESDKSKGKSREANKAKNNADNKGKKKGKSTAEKRVKALPDE